MTRAHRVPRVSVVIPTYRRHGALRRTLAALERQDVSPTDFEVIVVDDPEEDDSRAVEHALTADERPFEARLVHRHARGVSAARNAGWHEARAALVMFLGDDILADRDLLSQHLAWHEREPGATIGVLGHVRWADELEVTPFMRWIEHGMQFNYPAIEGEEAGYGHFYTANVSLQRAALEEVDGFDEERFPFLYEDLDLGYRLEQRGFRLLYNRRARAQHLHQTTIEEWRGRMAAAARAELEWVSKHPSMQPYFYELFADVGDYGPRRGRSRPLLRWVPPGTPWLGRRVWDNATVYYRQLLAPAFLGAWREADQRPAGSSPGGPK